MFVMTLESLVLRGVSVLCGGETVNPRLGAESDGKLQAPTIGNPMPHSMPVPALDERGRGTQWGSYPRLTPGAGRSRRFIGRACARKA